MTATAQGPRLVNPELIEKLDPLEKLIAHRFIECGKWRIQEAEGDKDE